MTRVIHVAFVCASLACAAITATAVTPQAQKDQAGAKGPAGMWRVQFATPLGQTAVNMTINQSGRRLFGQVTDEYGEYPITGEFVDGRVTITWSVPEEGKMLPITMRGTLKGDDIVGTAQLGDVGEGPLGAHRTGDAG